MFVFDFVFVLVLVFFFVGSRHGPYQCVFVCICGFLFLSTWTEDVARVSGFQRWQIRRVVAGNRRKLRGSVEFNQSESLFEDSAWEVHNGRELILIPRFSD